jgi:peptide/nickel transport system permease protein
MTFANIGVSMPVFWLGLLLQYVFALLSRTRSWPSRRRADSAPVSYPSRSTRCGAGRRHRHDGRGFLEFIGKLVIFNSLITARLDVMGTPSATSSSRPWPWPRSPWRSSPASPAPRCSRSSAATTSAPPGQGSGRAASRRQARLPQRHAPGRDDRRPATRPAVGRGRPHRDDLQPLRESARPCSRRSPPATTRSSRASSRSSPPAT